MRTGSLLGSEALSVQGVGDYEPLGVLDVVAQSLAEIIDDGRDVGGTEHHRDIDRFGGALPVDGAERLH